MREVLYFYSNQFIDKSSLERFLTDHVEGKEFHWLNNFYEYCIEYTADKRKIYISTERIEGDFCFYYSVFKETEKELPIRQRVELLKVLAQSLGAELLMSDDEVNPWSWILIEHTGETSTIEVRTDDELVISSAYNFPFGDFRTTHPLSDEQITLLNRLSKTYYETIQIHHSDDGPVVNGEFNKVKDSFIQLKNFDNHYELVPVGKTNWLSREEKSDAFIRLMNEFFKQTAIDLCIFPRNFSEVRNIEGGSDSEEYCLVISDKGQERIVYKNRRKSWLS